MAQENTSGAKYITSLDFNINKAIKSLESLDDYFKVTMSSLEDEAKKSITNINKTLGGLTINVGAEYKQASEKALKDVKKAKESFDKELAQILHDKKTGRIDAQTFLNQTEMYHSNFGALNNKEQLQLYNATLKAESEHRKVLDEKKNTEKAITAEMQKQKELAEKAWEAEKRKYAQSRESNKSSSVPVSQGTGDFNLLGSELQRRVSWFATGAGFYGMINAAGDTVKAIKDVEFGVTEIARVMEDSTFVFKDYRDELLQMGVDYGNTFENVQDIALRWAQAGYNVKDSLDLTKTSLMALNTAELDAKNATESLIGIMSQWGLKSNEMPLVLDKINLAADEYTVTSQDLVDGLLRSSSAAKIMGMSMDDTIASLTVLRESSGRTGKEVGNALNSMLSYIQRPSSINTFESLGIEVFADKAKTQFRNVMDIFSDISAQWGKLSPDIQDGFLKAADDAGLFNEELAGAIGIQKQWNDLQQRDLSQAAAGVYRRNYFIALINSFSKSQDVLNKLQEANGYTMRENTRTMETLEKKYQSFLTATKQLQVAIGDSGVEGFLKTLADAGTTGTQGLAGIVKAIGAIPPALATVLAMMSMFNKQLQFVNGKEYGVFGFQSSGALSGMKNLIQTTKDFYAVQMSMGQSQGVLNPTSWQKATMGVGAFSRALNASAIASKALGFALNTALNVGIGIAIGLAVEGLFKLINAQKEAEERAKMTAQELKQEQDALISLKEQYLELANTTEKTDDTKKSLEKIQQQLLQTYDLEANKLDLVNGKYGEQIKLIDEAIARKARETMTSMGSRADVAQQNLDKKDSTKVSVLAYTKELEQASNKIKNLEAGIFKSDLTGTDYFVRTTGTLEERRNALKELIETLKSGEQTSTTISIINDLADEYNKLGDEVKKNQEIVNTYAQNKNIDDFYSTFSASLGKVRSLMEDMKTVEDKSPYEEQLKRLKDQMLETAKTQGKLTEFTPMINAEFSKLSTGLKETTKSGNTLDNQLKDIQENAQNLNKDIGSLNQMISDMNNGNEMSVEQIYDLVDKYPQLAESIVKVKDAYGIEKTVLEQLRVEKINERKIALDAEVNKTKEVINQTFSRLNAYGVELSAIKDLQSARLEYQKLNLLGDMDFAGYEKVRSFTGQGGEFDTEKDYNGAKKAGEQMLKLGELYQSVEAKKKLLESRSYGVSTKTTEQQKENKALQESLKLLEHQKKMGQVSDEQELKRLKEISSRYVKTSEERMEMEERIYQLEKEIKDNRIKSEIDLINQKKDLGQLTVQQEIAAWEKIKKTYSNNIETSKEAELNLYKLRNDLRENNVERYKAQIDKEISLIKNSYDNQIDMIQKRAEEQKKAQEEIIQGIENEEKALDRSEKAYDHNKKIADLEKERKYHELRTGEEHRKAIAEIDKKISEENRDYGIEIEKQKLSDKKEAAQDEIKNIEDTSRKEIERWQLTYKQMEQDFDSHNIDIVAMAQNTSKAAYDAWYNNYIEPLKKSLQYGVLDGFESTVNGMSSSISKLPSHDWGMTDEDYNTFINNGNRWNDLSSAGLNNAEMAGLKKQNDALRKKYGRNPSLGEYPKFHTGAYTQSYGMAIFKPGELVFPPDLSSKLTDLIGAMYSPRWNGKQNTDKSIKIQTLLNIENNNMNDQIDGEILSRQLNKAIISLGG